MRSLFRPWPIAAGAALSVVVAAAVAGVGLPTAWAASSATINGATSYQPIDGFGFSSAFGRAGLIRSMSEANQQQVLDLLYSPTTGAGSSILRLGISSTSSSIQPTNPGGPNAAPRYVWDGADDGQVWLAKKVQAYGVSRFYADAWSAPGYMKNNGTENNGGTLCGLSGAGCSSGDWRRAYANYLVQYAKYYGQEGVDIDEIGFTNEPNYTTSYSSMRFTPAQAAEFAKILGPVADAAGFKTVCCDAVGWDAQRSYSSAILADSEAARWVSTHTGHSYGSDPTSPLASGGRHTWMSEWAPSSTAWNPNWDSGSGTDGFAVAQKIHTALTAGNVNAYVYWYGISSAGTAAFIQGDGTSYNVSKRLWAMASYSRYIRPGATRIGATTADGNLRLSAYRNTDGSVIVVALNAASTATSVSYALQNTGVTTGTATPYVTNSSSSMTAQSPIGIGAGAFTANVPARSLVTYRITGDATPPSSPPPSSASPSDSSSPSVPPAGSCTASMVAGTVFGDRYNTTVNVSGATNWTVTVTLTAPQKVSSTWNAAFTWSGGGYVMTARPNGSGNSFGFTTMFNGNSSARPRVSCSVS